MSAAVFIDSGAFIALMSQRDRWHAGAVALFGGPKPRWHTSMLVVAETYTWFLHRAGEEHARSFRLLLENLKGLNLIAAPSDHHADVCRVLDRFRGSRLSYTDASSLVHIEKKRIGIVWSTDHHLGLTGAQVLPRS